ncbi:hypothetical protein LM597_00720, partial [Candidatus Acetothermia bacterium]|nr:hypothetical protein [Candidatus Acetothermia bacterium]
ARSSFPACCLSVRAQVGLRAGMWCGITPACPFYSIAGKNHNSYNQITNVIIPRQAVSQDEYEKRIFDL